MQRPPLASASDQGHLTPDMKNELLNPGMLNPRAFWPLLFTDLATYIFRMGLVAETTICETPALAHIHFFLN